MVPLLVQLFCSSVANCAPSDLTGDSLTNVQAISANTNIVKEAGALYRTVVDKDSGQYAVVDTNNEVVALKDKADKVMWSVKIEKITEALEASPRLRGRKIQGMRMHNGELWVDVGRGYAVIDVKTGALRGIASN
jgi:hypothetical protein